MNPLTNAVLGVVFLVAGVAATGPDVLPARTHTLGSSDQAGITMDRVQ